MTAPTPDVLEALRLPELCRAVCLYAGIALPPVPDSADRFVLRSGTESPEWFAKLLEEAFLEDEAEAYLCPPDGPTDAPAPGPGAVAIRAGFDFPCPAAEELRRAVQPHTGPVLLFAIERRDAGGRLLGVTWVAVPEEEPPPEAEFRAAVLRQDVSATPE